MIVLVGAARFELATPSAPRSQATPQEIQYDDEVIYSEETMKLTDISAVNITLPAEKKDHVIYDDAVPRFGVGVCEGDTRKKWIIKYKLTVKG